MPKGGGKMKTKRGAAKRFRVSGTGRIKRAKAYRSHILTKKTTKRKRHLRKREVVDRLMQRMLRGLVPVK
jgi:large subunit ribosomal protein L35